MPVEYEPTEALVLRFLFVWFILMFSWSHRNLKNLLAGDPMMPVTHKMMPRFLYPDGYVWDPSCPMVDLFKGHFLIYVSDLKVLILSHLLTGLGYATTSAFSTCCSPRALS